MSEGKIYQVILDIMKDIGAVGKDKKNAQQGFSFRGVDDAMNATHDLFAKHGVFVVPQVMERVREERTTKAGGAMFSTVCRVKYTFFASDGSSIEAIIDGEGMDTADKSTSKAQAIAFKYALFQVLDIPTEEMPDPDATTPEPTKAEPANVTHMPPKYPTQTTPPPLPPEGESIITAAQRKVLQKECIKPDGSQDDERTGQLKMVMAKRGYDSTKDIKQRDYEQIRKEFVEYGLPFDV